MHKGFLSGVIALLGLILLTACASPRMSAELETGKMAFQSGDYKKAFHDLLPVVKAGRPEAQYAVGYMYYYGYGVPRDVSAGLFWIGRASSQQYVPANQALERIRQDNEAADASTSEAVAHPYKAAAAPSTVASVGVKAKKAKNVVKWKKPKKSRTLKTASATVSVDSVADHSTSVTDKSCAASAARYVLQLYGSWQYNKAAQLRKQLGLNGQASVCVTPREGKNWYVLVTGEFANMPAARHAKAALPARLKSLNPWIRVTKDLSAADS